MNKISLKAFCLFIVILIINLNTFAKEQSPEVERANNIQIDKVNSLFSQTSALNEELGSIVQYIGQAINTNKIKPQNKISTQNWIIKLLKDVNKLQEIPIIITLSYIFNLNLTINKLLIKTHANLKNNFNDIEYEDLESISKAMMKTQKNKVSLKDIEIIIQKNKILINFIKNQAYQAGLSNVNKLVRKVDEINDKYKILPTLITGIATAGFLTAIIYTLDNIPKLPRNNSTSLFSRRPSNLLQLTYVPENQIHQNSSIINKLKNIKLKWLLSPIIKYKKFLGEKPKYYQSGNFKGQLANGNKLGKIGKIDHFIFRDPDVQKVLSIGTVAGSYYFGNELKYFKDNLQNLIKNKWENLKGYNNINTGYTNKSYTIESSLTLSDERLVGLEEQIDKLKKVAYYVVEPDIYDRQGVSIGKGILLTGPTRTGKTMLARALSGEINKMLRQKDSTKSFGFKEVKFVELMRGENAVERLLDEAKNNAPCILFIDEIHNLPLQSQGWNKTLNDFLTGMSGINSESDSKHQIIMLAATNKPEHLDSALLQPGRFGNIIHFNRPHYENRKKYFETMLKRNMFDPNQFNLSGIAKQTQNCSYGDLEEILREARFNARRESKRLNQEHIQSKINSHVHRFKLTFPLNNKEIDIVASYQAGKILSSILYNCSNDILLVSLLGKEPKLKEKSIFQNAAGIKEFEDNKKIEYGHIIKYNNQEALQTQDFKDYIKEAKKLLSGHIAQKILLNNIYPSYRSKDKNKAINYIKKDLLNNIEESELSKKEKESIKSETLKILKDYEQEITDILTENKEKLNNLYLKFKSKITLYKKDIQALIDLKS